MSTVESYLKEWVKDNVKKYGTRWPPDRSEIMEIMESINKIRGHHYMAGESIDISCWGNNDPVEGVFPAKYYDSMLVEYKRNGWVMDSWEVVLSREEYRECLATYKARVD